MSELFTTRPRTACICGEKIDPHWPRTEVATPLGSVLFARCASCASHVQTPQLDATSLARWYNSPAYQGSASDQGAGYHDYFADEKNRILEGQARYERQLASFLPARATILEIGCATGSQLVALRQAGHRVCGIDLSSGFADYARKHHDLHVVVGDFLNVDLPSAPFDMVLLLGTLSNLSDPQRHLSRILTVLKPGGVCIANLPVADSWIARLYGPRFWMFTPSVSSFMSRKGLVQLFSSAGFTDLTITRDRQCPSLGKLAHHARLTGLLNALRIGGLSEVRLPVSIPLPGIIQIAARCPPAHP